MTTQTAIVAHMRMKSIAVYSDTGEGGIGRHSLIGHLPA
jgi:hypothetical protein